MGLPRFLQNRWWIVFAAAIGLMVGTGSILIISFAVFVRPVTEELGWGRGAFSFALVVMGIVTVIASPIFGTLIDRLGIKQVSLPLIAVLSLSIITMSLMGPSLIVMYAIYAMCAFVSPPQAPLMYSKAVSMWFDRERGIALGLATSGSGLGTVLIPLEAQYLIGHFGWRMAYVGLGVTNFVLAFTMVALFIREPPGYRLNRRNDQIAPVPEAELPPGVSMREAAKSWRFWALTIVFTLGGAAINGTLAHIVALLTDRGMSAPAAAGILSSSGLAVITGRLLGGWLLDRSARPVTPSLLLVLPAIGCALLAIGLGGSIPVIAVMLIGFGIGVELDMMGFFVSRYFGLRSFGQIFGFMFPGFAIGVGVGPFLMGLSYDLTHSYDIALIGNATAMVLAAALLAGLGAYVYTKPQQKLAGEQPA